MWIVAHMVACSIRRSPTSRHQKSGNPLQVTPSFSSRHNFREAPEPNATESNTRVVLVCVANNLIRLTGRLCRPITSIRLMLRPCGFGSLSSCITSHKLVI